jgi:hypothetical protein
MHKHLLCVWPLPPRGNGRRASYAAQSRHNFREEQKRMKLLYVFNTRIGPFYIGERDGRFHPIYHDESLGSYAQAWQAAEDLAGGHTFSLSSAIDTARLGIPADLGEWERVSNQ